MISTTGITSLGGQAKDDKKNDKKDDKGGNDATFKQTKDGGLKTSISIDGYTVGLIVIFLC